MSAPLGTAAATALVEVPVALSSSPDAPPNTLVVYDWFSYHPEVSPPRAHNAVEVLVDGEQAWARVHGDLMAAERDVRVATWMLRADIELIREPQATLDPPGTRAANRFGDVIEALAARGVTTRILIWGMTFTPLVNRWLRRWYWRVPANIDILEQDHPVLIGSHHQKTITIDGRVGYCGGMNLKENDWDTTGHAVFEARRMPHASHPRRRRLVAAKRKPSAFAPRHDLALRIEGPAVADLDANFTERWAQSVAAWRRSPVARIAEVWRRATGRRLPPDLGAPLQAPEAAPGETFVQIVRTRPKRQGGLFSAPPAEDSILDTYKRAIANARKYIYIENQYFRSKEIGHALADAVARNPRLHLEVVAWPINDGKKSWLNPSGYWTAYTQNLIRDAQRAAGIEDAELFQLTRVQSWDRDHAGAPTLRQIDVHAKIMIIDDVWLTVGSANINDRGFKYEGEINAVVLDAAHARGLRRRLMGEHLAIPTTDPRLADVDSAFALWREHADDNPSLVKADQPPRSRVHHFVQAAPARPPFGVGSGVF